MALGKQNLHLYQTLVRAVLLQKNGFYRQKTKKFDTNSTQMSACKAKRLMLISQPRLFCRKMRFLNLDPQFLPRSTALLF